MTYYDQPNYTMVPNKLLDLDMAELSGCELKVLLYIVRHTLGYGKTVDAISYKQITQGIPRPGEDPIDRGTGLKSRSSVAAALDSLEGRGCIHREHATSADGDPDITHYRLSVHQCDVRQPSRRGAGGVVQKSDYGSPKSGLEVVQELDRGVVQKSDYGSPKSGPTKENVQKKTVQKKTNQVCGAAEPHRAHAGLEMVPTQDDEQAPAARRLALRLAGDVLDCRGVTGQRLARYEAFCADLLGVGWSVDDLCTWMDWMASGTCFWAGKSRKWTEAAMLADLENWDGDGRPSEKEDDGG